MQLGSGSTLVRSSPQNYFNLHRHYGGKEIFVVDGVFEDEQAVTSQDRGFEAVLACIRGFMQVAFAANLCELPRSWQRPVATPNRLSVSQSIECPWATAFLNGNQQAN